MVTRSEQEPYENTVSGRVIGAAIEVHKMLGPGLLESAYEECLCHELSLAGLQFERQKAVPIRYKDLHVESGYRLDIVVEGCVLIELKSVAEVAPVHEAQLLTYLKLTGLKLGLLLNFNVPRLTEGITRMVNKL